MISVREETTQDHDAVRHINQRAFAAEGEARIVDNLRANCADVLSLVAESDGQVVGHIFFSPVEIKLDGSVLGGNVQRGTFAAEVAFVHDIRIALDQLIDGADLVLSCRPMNIVDLGEGGDRQGKSEKEEPGFHDLEEALTASDRGNVEELSERGRDVKETMAQAEVNGGSARLIYEQGNKLPGVIGASKGGVIAVIGGDDQQVVTT